MQKDSEIEIVAPPSPINGGGDKSSSTPSPDSPEYNGEESLGDDYSNINLKNIKYVTKNKTMTYYGANVQQPTPLNVKSLTQKIYDRYESSRKTMPVGYYDDVIYTHRKSAKKAYSNYDGLAMTATNENELGDPMVRIGDCNFVVPPEFITCNTSSSHESIQGIRQSGSINIKNGFSTKDIQLNLVLSGMEQINGYEVESPFEYKYYLDGLRALISQFKYTPFVPIENDLINIVHDVDNVALRNLSVQTIPGFPGALNVVLSMQEFNAEAYTCMPNSILTDCIEWNLYRYYTQRPLQPNHKCYLKKIDSPNLTSKFKFKILSDDAIARGDKQNSDLKNPQDSMVIEDTDLHINLFDESNYKLLIDDSKDIVFTGMSFSMGNIMPTIQLSAHESPTMQYLGSTDTTFTFNFETNNEEVASLFNQIMKQNNYIVRTNRYKNGVGFIKIENEFVQLTGTNFLLLTNISVSTVPEFPGLHNIVVECVSFDANQKDKEKLIGIRPFPGNREGTRKDLISQSAEGLGNKIYQDAIMEQRIMELELYPDLYLPTYYEVDEAIKKINKFRAKYKMGKMSINKYPRQKMVLPGSPKKRTYNGYVDPDFYVFYPNSQSDIQNRGSNDKKPLAFQKMAKATEVSATSDKDVKKTQTQSSRIQSDEFVDLFHQNEIIPDVAIEPEYAYGYEGYDKRKVHKSILDKYGKENEIQDNSSLSESGTFEFGSGSGDNTKTPNPNAGLIRRVTGNPFVDFLCDRADARCGYIYGAKGEMCTKKFIEQKVREHGKGRYYGEGKQPEKWIGRIVYDCSGFVNCGLNYIGMKLPYRVAASTHTYGTVIPNSQRRLGDLLYHSKHVAVYLGNDKTVEASGTNAGVVYGKYKSKYKVCRVKGLEEACRKFLQNNPNFYKKTGSASSELAPTSSATGTGNPVLGQFSGSLAKVNRWDSLILKNAKLFNFDPNFIKCIIAIESSGNPNCSYKGAVGLMQVLLKYHRDKIESPNVFDPDANIKAGCKIWDEYGKKYGYDTKVWIASYNAGPAYAARLLKDPNAKIPKITVAYIEKYRKYYAELMASGGNSAGLIKPTDGGMEGNAIFGDGSSAGGEEPFVWPYKDEDFKNPNANKKHGYNISNIMDERIGEDNIMEIGSISGNGVKINGTSVSKKIQSQNNPDHNIESMYVNTTKYSMMGSLARAFPSYIFMILDEQPDWIDNKKLWTNYYVCRNLIEVNVHEDMNNPVSTLTATLSNFHNNLSKAMKSKSLGEIMYGKGNSNGIWGTINSMFYNLTGAILDEKISDEMIRYKNILYREIDLNEGARIHLRLGYGSNPARYDVNFCGNITQLTDGEVITIAAQSDGIELSNNPVTDKSNATNQDAGLPDEVSNIIAKLFVERESEFIYGFTSGLFKIRSRNGIEHFGGYLKTTAGLSTQQYDIVKNIYNGEYTGVPYCAKPLSPFDGENNFKFFATGKVPWDIIKMCEKAVPDFVGYPRYHHFESRIFYGLPMWYNRYKYDVDTSTGKLYEYSKAFTQVHEISSLHSIIDNNIKIDTRNLATNAIGLYTIGGDLASTPVIMSDNDIDWSRQKTKTIDTTSVQDFSWVPGFIDKFISWSGLFDNGKQMAINICVSELMEYWRNTYTGNIIVTGRPEIHCNDYVYLDDNVLYMSGPIVARQVIHSFSISTGLITTIVPGVIANNTLKKSGLTNVVKSMVSLSAGIALGSQGVLLATSAFNKVSNAYKSSRKAEYITKGYKNVKNFTMTNGAKAYEFVKNGKIVTKMGSFLKESEKLVKIAGKVKKLGGIAKTAFSAAKVVCSVTPAGLAVVVSSLVIEVLINKMLTFVAEMFKYKNTITLYPLMLNKPNNQPRAYIGNVKGGKDILPYNDIKSQE